MIAQFQLHLVEEQMVDFRFAHMCGGIQKHLIIICQGANLK